MEELARVLKQTVSLSVPPSDMGRRTSNALRILASQSEGFAIGKTATVSGLDLIPSPQVSEQSILKAAAFTEQNFGVKYAPEKWIMLSQMMVSEGWSEERFKRTYEHFLTTQKYPNWTVADWFSFDIDVHPYAWYLEQVHVNGVSVNLSIECYKLPNGKICYRYVDGQTLPFPRKMIRDREWVG